MSEALLSTATVSLMGSMQLEDVISVQAGKDSIILKALPAATGVHVSFLLRRKFCVFHHIAAAQAAVLDQHHKDLWLAKQCL